MELNDYQMHTRTTAVYPGAGEGQTDAVVYTALGLAGEAGEIANKVKKILRDNGGVLTHDVAAELAKEVGDALWYLARFSDELGYPLSNIAEGNLAKLMSRKERGVIGGSGDER
jgi:NTP pyrophosphatase (non-canonical NTP hydrolase)